MANKRPVWFSDDHKTAYTTTPHGDLVSVDYEDRQWLLDHSWSKTLSGAGYASAWVGNRPQKLHRLLRPDWSRIDHVNGNGLDSRACNLRSASARENGANVGVQVRNSSGFRGVSKHQGAWRAHLGTTVTGRNYGVASWPHTTPRAAAAAADAIEREFQPDFMRWRTTPVEADAAYANFTAKNLARIAYVKGLIECSTNASQHKNVSRIGSKLAAKQAPSASTQKRPASTSSVANTPSLVSASRSRKPKERIFL